MTMLKTLGAATVVTFAATAAFAGGCNWGNHSAAVTAEAEVEEPAMSTPVQVATLTCDSLTGDALATCLADQAKTQ